MVRRSFVILVCLSFISLPVLAQRQTATVTGTITDQTQSALPGALATLSSPSTGFTRSSVSGATGLYTIGDVPAGSYFLKVELDGFKTALVNDVELNVADTRRVDVQLELGAVEEEVTSMASAVVVETIGGEVAGLITGEQVRELPLNGRNFAQLTLLMPGVSAPDGFNTKNKGLLTGSDLSISGGAVTGNMWTVDGANNNDVGSNRTILIYPSVDAIEEFKIHRNSYGPELGAASGAVINLITRGGTNEYHGAAYWFKRDDSLNNTNYFLKQAGQDKEALTYDDYGFNFGGPIKRDKLHFFWSEEWNAEQRGTVRTGLVPTAAERAGDFSGAGIPGCTPPVPIDPLTGNPFPGNVIPADRLSPAGQAYLNLYPLPNTTPSSGSCNNWVASVDTPIDWRQDNIRFDYSVTDSSRLMLRYTQDSWVNDAPNAGANNGLWGDDPFPAVDSAWDQPGKSLALQLNQTIGATAVNTLQFSYSGNKIGITRGGDNAALNGQITSLLPTVFPTSGKLNGADVPHATFWGGQGYDSLWNIPPWENHQDLYVLKDDYQRVFGRHYVKAGALYSDNAKDENIGSASFEVPAFWGAAGINGWGATTGNVLADFLLEDMTWGFSENANNINVQQRWNDYEIYVGDSWSVKPGLTIDAGVRYSNYKPPTEVNNTYSSFNPDAFDPALGSDPCNGILLPPGSTACSDKGFSPGTPGPNGTLVNSDTNNFAPRFGFAWDVFGTGETAIRGGFGQFFQRERLSPWLVMASNPPFNNLLTGIRRLDDNQEPCAGCFASTAGVPVNGYDPNRETPYTLQWNLTWEQRIFDETTIEVSYVGSRGVHLMRRVDINQVPGGDGNGNGIPDRLEYVRIQGDATAQGNLRPISAFGDASVNYWMNDGKSKYESLQTQLISRFGRGSQFQVSYTWSNLKADDPLTDSGTGNYAGQVTDLGNLGLDYGNAEINRTHILNSSLVYHMPTFEDRGKAFAALLGDWSVGTIVSYASGTSLTVYTGAVPGLNSTSGTGYNGNERPNRVPGEPCRASGGPKEQWLNPNAWTLDGFQLGTIGNSGRGVCDGPDFFQVDLSLYKNFRITDRVDGQLRFEIFNIFDRVNFRSVDNTLDPSSVTLDTGDSSTASQITSATIPSTFGQATATRDPRQIQIGFKLIF